MRRLMVVGVACAGLVLGACSEQTKEQLGLRRTAPDEFAVVTRAPLSVPPDYELRPPRPGEARPQETSVREVARQTVFGPEKKEGTKVGNSFMSKIGAADPSIRTTVDSESADGVEDGGKPVAEKLKFWKSSNPDDKGVKLDPIAEQERLKKSAPEKQ